MKKIILTIGFFLIELNNLFGFSINSTAVISVKDSLYNEFESYSDTTKTSGVKSNQNAYEEAYLAFNYLGIINRTIVVNYDGNFYLPLREIFQQLLIDYQVDKQSEVIRGFYIYPDSLYEIDFKNLEFKSYKTEFTFSENEFIKTDLDYYLGGETSCLFKVSSGEDV